MRRYGYKSAKRREVRGIPGRMVKVHPGMAAVSTYDGQPTRSEQRQPHRVLSTPNPPLTRGQNTWESVLGSGLDLASLDHTLGEPLLSAHAWELGEAENTAAAHSSVLL